MQMSCKSHLLAAAARWLSHEHFHPSVPKLLCFQFALDNFVAGGPCSWPTPASPCIEDRLHHRIPFWCCPNLNPMRTSTATPSHGKVILYLSLKDWDSFSSQAFKCWLYQLKKKYEAESSAKLGSRSLSNLKTALPGYIGQRTAVAFVAGHQS